MRIDRCICTEQRFERLLAIARARGLSLTQLMDDTEAGKGCGLCRPYLARCLRTGETCFHEVIRESDEPESQWGDAPSPRR